jgi:malate dehydrogenase (oxaloacetate-decarboxylating)(NADP+)
MKNDDNKNRLKEEALRYHSEGRPGKLEVLPIKPYSSQKDLSLAYSPGVAYPCLEIEKNPDDAYRYTSKTNLVAVISNGTAVLGLGDIGALAGKPVMEGKDSSSRPSPTSTYSTSRWTPVIPTSSSAP